MKKIAKRKKKKMVQAIKVPTHFRVIRNEGTIHEQEVLIQNNDPYAGKTKFIKHKPTVTGSGKF